MNVTDSCFTNDNGTKYCNNGKENLEFFVNGNKTKSIADYVFNDDDRILITYGKENTTEINRQLQELNNLPINKK